MKKALFDLAIEFTGHDKNSLTEHQENEIDALVQFGKRVLENAAQQSTRLTVCRLGDNPIHYGPFVRTPEGKSKCTNCGEQW